eukprot:GHVS01043952.1.p2 GENE.GHVS01043952.1~~GHVS01043952.1.p2  ORF type:complete len:138 (+),score=13.30 GHVS01043952.1:152-565(+)
MSGPNRQPPPKIVSVNWMELHRRLRHCLPPMSRRTDLFLSKLPDRIREAQAVCRNLPSQLGRSFSKTHTKPSRTSSASLWSSSWSSSLASAKFSSFGPLLLFLRSYRSRGPPSFLSLSRFSRYAVCLLVAVLPRWCL